MLRTARGSRQRPLRRLLRGIALLLVAVVAAAATYVTFAMATLGLFSWLYEGSGHPPLPNAPEWLWIATFAVAGPLLSLALGAAAAGFLRRRFRRRMDDAVTPETAGPGRRA